MWRSVGLQHRRRHIHVRGRLSARRHRATAELHEGDRVRIGEYQLSFHVRAEPRLAGAARPLAPPPKPVAAPAPGAFATAADGPCLARATGERLRLRVSDATRIGRALDNDIVLEDASVSRHHAVIESRNGGHVLRDLGSQNGTWLADNRDRKSVV